MFSFPRISTLMLGYHSIDSLLDVSYVSSNEHDGKASTRSAMMAPFKSSKASNGNFNSR